MVIQQINKLVARALTTQKKAKGSSSNTKEATTIRAPNWPRSILGSYIDGSYTAMPVSANRVIEQIESIQRSSF
eukprot:7106338-Pyramimonas_sp.AAC.1